MSARRGFPRLLHEGFQLERVLPGLKSGRLGGISQDYRQRLRVLAKYSRPFEKSDPPHRSVI